MVDMDHISQTAWFHLPQQVFPPEPAAVSTVSGPSSMDSPLVGNPCQPWQQLSQWAMSCPDRTTLLNHCTALIGQTLAADLCLLGWTDHLHQPGQVGVWAQQPVMIANPSIPSAAFYNCPTHPTVLLTGALTHPEILGSRLTHLWRSLVSAEIISANAQVLEVAVQQAGGMAVMSLARSNCAWSEADCAKACSLVQHAAFCLSYWQLQHHHQQQGQFQSVISQVMVALRHAVDVSDVLRLTTEATAQALGVDRGLALTLKYQHPQWRHYPTSSKPQVTIAQAWTAPQVGQTTPSDRGPSFPLTDCSLCQQAFNQAPQILALSSANRSDWQANLAHPASSLDVEPCAALLIAPLENQGTILGFLMFQHHQPHNWSLEELELVELLRAQVSTAIMQTETLRQVQSLVEQRTAELQQSLSIQAKLYERTRQQLEQLRHLNQLKDEFLDTVSHELRTPLTSMSMAIHMLRQVGTDSDRSQRYLDILEQQCTQEKELIEDLLTFQELESKQVLLHPQPFDLLTVVHAEAATFQQQWQSKGVTLHVDVPGDAPICYSDRSYVRRILGELLTNAGKYAHPNTSVQFSLQPPIAIEEQTWKIHISNIGAGIPQTELPHIFDKFRRGQKANHSAIRGTGLGLALVQSLIHHLRGQISVSSQPISETGTDHQVRFSLDLPQCEAVQAE